MLQIHTEVKKKKHNIRTNPFTIYHENNQNLIVAEVEPATDNDKEYYGGW